MPAKKKPGTIVTLKNGAKAKVMESGRYKFISGPTKGRALRNGVGRSPSAGRHESQGQSKNDIDYKPASTKSLRMPSMASSLEIMEAAWFARVVSPAW